MPLAYVSLQLQLFECFVWTDSQWKFGTPTPAFMHYLSFIISRVPYGTAMTRTTASPPQLPAPAARRIR